MHHAIPTPPSSARVLRCVVAVAAAFAISQTATILAAAPPPAGSTTAPPGSEFTWPRQISADSATLLVYQPQIDEWKGQSFSARCAIQAQAPAQGQPQAQPPAQPPGQPPAQPPGQPQGQSDTFGLVRFSGRADVDKAARVVTVSDVAITEVSFPTAPSVVGPYKAALEAAMPSSRVLHFSLDQLEATMAMSQELKRDLDVQVQNAPPRIVVATSPTILVLVDGAPVVRPASPGSSVNRVMNSQTFIAQEASGPWFLKAGGKWFTSPSLDGQWTTSSGVPVSIDASFSAAAAAKQVDPMQAKDGSTAPDDTTIEVSTVPAELISIDGQPQFSPIEGTNLIEVANTNSPLFRDVDDGQVYVLISGRWFKAPSLDGPWAFVPGSSLPAQFARIPPASPRSNVLVSVPGTPQAKEAMIAATIPQTATVQRSAASLTVSYDGPPRFVPVISTPLKYAENTVTPVIQVSPGGFYAVQAGVWFTAPAPTGPWVVATSVPQVIYTIPASSPLHYVTYVRVYGSTPQVVYVGYTPGYYGVCVVPDGTVVYGTGYVYPAYVGTVYYPPPPTYGYGAGFAVGALTGFAFGYAAGTSWGCYHYGYWGPYACGWGARDINVNVNTTNVYNHWGTQVATVQHAYGSNSWNGNEWSATRGATFNPYNGRTTAGAGGEVHNPYTGNWAAGAHGAFYNPSTGVAGAAGGHAEGTSGGVTNSGSHGAVYNTSTGNGVGWDKNNVYADKDGTIHTYDRDQGWKQQSPSGQWSASEASRTQGLQQQAWGRNLGDQRFQGFQGGGGAFRQDGGGARFGGWGGAARGGFGRR